MICPKRIVIGYIDIAMSSWFESLRERDNLDNAFDWIAMIKNNIEAFWILFFDLMAMCFLVEMCQNFVRGNEVVLGCFRFFEQFSKFELFDP